MKIKKGDTVQIITGKDRGKSGKVLRVTAEGMRAMVEGLNVFKKHSRPRREGAKGEIVSVSRPVHISNLLLQCPRCNKGVRIGYRIEGEKKTRYCKKCKGEL